MRYCSLGSGSKGNATLIEHGGHSVLIDCGFSRKGLWKRFEAAAADPALVRAMLVTHEHSDHAKGALSVCELLDIPLFSSWGTARKMGWHEHPLWRLALNDETVRIETLLIRPVTVPHDAAEPLQYVIRDSDGMQVGVLSDLGSVTPHVLEAYQGCHGLQLEANHDPVMLRNGPYPPALQARVAGRYGHLSNAQCGLLLSELMWSGVRHIAAGHISEKNNSPELVRQELAAVLRCQPEAVNLLVQDGVSDWCELR